MRKCGRRLLSSIGLPFAALAATLALGAASSPQDPLEAVEGLWAYTTLQSPGGEERPLTGIILFKDGIFAQQSIFDASPFEKQLAMAHAGPYRSGPRGVHLVAEQTIAITPGEEMPLSFRKDTQHDISVDRKGDEMTIVFKTGTIQKFRRIGPAEGKAEAAGQKVSYARDRSMKATFDGKTFTLADGRSFRVES